MKLNQDSKEIFISYLSTVLEFYKIFMACLLVIFVPQYCEDTKSTCTFKQNFENLSRYNEFVIFYNFATLSSFIYLYYIQSKRETYWITHLEVNKNKPDNGLQESLSGTGTISGNEKYEKILNRVKYYNILINNITKKAIINFYINAVFSSILILYYYYDGFRSVTTLITSILLVSQKLYSTYVISSECLKDKPLALSLVRLEPISFNDIDPDYRLEQAPEQLGCDYRARDPDYMIKTQTQDSTNGLPLSQNQRNDEIEIKSSS
jgi:hypothetical protein